jgi:hypothetical protein
MPFARPDPMFNLSRNVGRRYKSMWSKTLILVLMAALLFLSGCAALSPPNPIPGRCLACGEWMYDIANRSDNVARS